MRVSTPRTCQDVTNDDVDEPEKNGGIVARGDGRRAPPDAQFQVEVRTHYILARSSEEGELNQRPTPWISNLRPGQRVGPSALDIIPRSLVATRPAPAKPPISSRSNQQTMSQQNLEDVLLTAGGPVDLLRNSQI